MTRKSRGINRTSFSGIAGMFTRSLRKTATPDARVSAQGLRKGPRCIVLLSFIYAQVSTHFLFALTLFSSSFTVSLFIYFFSCSRVSNANRKKKIVFPSRNEWNRSRCVARAYLFINASGGRVVFMFRS